MLCLSAAERLALPTMGGRGITRFDGKTFSLDKSGERGESPLSGGRIVGLRKGHPMRETGFTASVAKKWALWREFQNFGDWDLHR